MADSPLHHSVTVYCVRILQIFLWQLWISVYQDRGKRPKRCFLHEDRACTVCYTSVSHEWSLVLCGFNFWVLALYVIKFGQNSALEIKFWSLKSDRVTNYWQTVAHQNLLSIQSRMLASWTFAFDFSRSKTRIWFSQLDNLNWIIQAIGVHTETSSSFR